MTKLEPTTDPQTCLSFDLMDLLACRAGVHETRATNYLTYAWARANAVISQITLDDPAQTFLGDTAALFALAKGAMNKGEHVTAVLLALTALEQVEAAAGWLADANTAKVTNHIVRSWQSGTLNRLELCSAAASSLARREKAGANTISFADELLLLARDGRRRDLDACLLAILANRQAIKDLSCPSWKIGLHYFLGTDELVSAYEHSLPVLLVKVGQQITLKVTGLPTHNELQIRLEQYGNERIDTISELTGEATSGGIVWNGSHTEQSRVTLEVYEKIVVGEKESDFSRKLLKTFIFELRVA